MLPFLIPAIAGLGLGVAKAASSMGKEKRKHEESATTKRWSPFTNMKARPVQSEPSPWSTILGMGLQGAKLGLGVDDYLNGDSSTDVKQNSNNISSGNDKLSNLTDPDLKPWEDALIKRTFSIPRFNHNPRY